MKEVNNQIQFIDSRDFIARIEELEAELQDVFGEIGNAEGFEDWLKLTTVEREQADELILLRKVQAEAESSPDWIHGEQLIREDAFTDYIEQLIDDCYEMPKDLDSGKWPYCHMKIDYEAAAEEAKQDYQEVDFDGVTYLIRA